MRWFRVYTEILDDPKVDQLPGDDYKAWVKLLALASRAERDGVLPSVPEIAHSLRLRADKVRRIMEKLETLGLVDRTLADEYCIHNWAKRQYKSDDSTARVSRWRAEKQAETTPDATLHATLMQRPRVVTSNDAVTPPDPRVQSQRQSTDTEKGAGAPRSRKRESVLTAAQMPEFEEWWRQFPRHEDRKGAEGAWAEVNGDGARTGEIMAGLRRNLPVLSREGGQYCPYGVRWLRNRRWTDEPTLAAASGARPGRPSADDSAAAAKELLARKRAGLSQDDGRAERPDNVIDVPFRVRRA